MRSTGDFFYTLVFSFSQVSQKKLLEVEPKLKDNVLGFSFIRLRAKITEHFQIR